MKKISLPIRFLKSTFCFFILVLPFGCNDDLADLSNEKIIEDKAVVIYNSSNQGASASGRISDYVYNGFVTRDRLGDLYAFAAGNLSEFSITEPSTFKVGNGFNTSNEIFSADFNGDKKNDILYKDGSNLKMYYWNNVPGYYSYYRPGNGAIVFQNAFFSNYFVADFTGDGNSDLIVRNSSGVLFLYPWSNSLGFNQGYSGIQVGHGFNFTHFFVADWDSDGTADLICRDQVGTLKFYPCKNSTFYGNGGGNIIGNRFDFVNYYIGEFTGDNLPDLVGRTSSGDLKLYPFMNNTFIGNNGGRVIGSYFSANTFLCFGNFNSKPGFYDLLAINSSNNSVLHYQYNKSLRLITSASGPWSLRSYWGNGFFPGFY
jgi:hypothetical protein